MKKGFTLPEVLITLGIIGIIAAVTIPAVSRLRPNEVKVRYMKAYNALTTLIPQIMDNEEWYHDVNYVEDDQSRGITVGDSDCIGLGCYAVEDIRPWSLENYTAHFNDPPGQFIDHFRDSLNATRIPCANLNLPNIWGVNFAQASVDCFETVDGIKWAMRSEKSFNRDPANEGTERADFRQLRVATQVYIDVNTKDETPQQQRETLRSKLYSANNTDPYVFEFEVDTEGGVTAVDALGRAFLENPTDMHNIQRDKDRAAEIAAGN